MTIHKQGLQKTMFYFSTKDMSHVQQKYAFEQDYAKYYVTSTQSINSLSPSLLHSRESNILSVES